MIDGNCASRFGPINITSHLWFGIVFLVVLLWASAVSAIPSCYTKTPLPQDLNLIVPGPEIDADIRRFAGVWNGSWEDEVCTTLVVQEVFENGYARVIYSYGTGAEADIDIPRFMRATGKIADGTLHFHLPRTHAKFVYRFEGEALRATYNDEIDATLHRVADSNQVGCGQPDNKRTAHPPANDRRDQVTAAQLLKPTYAGDGPVHNHYFMPVGKAAAALHALSGTLEIKSWSMFTAVQGCPGLAQTMPGFTVAIFTHGDELVPVARDVVNPGAKWHLILSPGKVWSEPDDNGMSRASFPFVMTKRLGNATHNGLATFLYDHQRVSALRFQIVQETRPWSKYDAWGQIPMVYTPREIPNEEAVRVQFAQEIKHRTPIRPWSDLEKAYPSPWWGSFDGESPPEDISANGLIVDQTLYLRPCRTRYGPYPYCRDMRHGVYSVTKSMGAGLAMLRLAQKYGESVFSLKIKDYVTVTATHNGWDEVTFGDALDMATGIGDRAPRRQPNVSHADEHQPKLYDWIRAPTTQEKLRRAFTYGNYPWGPGELLRYNSTHTFILSVAMDTLLKRKEGPSARLWDMMKNEVFTPIGVRHAPILHSYTAQGTQDIPILGYGFYPTVDDTAKIATLLQNGGKHNGRQLLHAEYLQNALYQGRHLGLPAGRRNRFGSYRYNMSFWAVPYKTTDCVFHLPYMAGYGGNFVVLLPNGISTFRYGDGWDTGLESMILSADAIRPLCPSASISQAIDMPEAKPLTASQLRAELAGVTLRSRRTELHLRADGTLFGTSRRGSAFDVGKWAITANGLYCRAWNVWREGRQWCYTVYQQGERFTFVQKGQWRKFTLVRMPKTAAKSRQQ